MDRSFCDWIKRMQTHMEAALAAFLPAPSKEQGKIQLPEAMRYAVLDGGKRVRPLLVFAAGELVNGGQDELTRAACAIEMIHAYSLVHDDMPCMDNDAMRRGKPTVHIKFGEAMALLAGDALQAHAFAVLAQGKNPAVRQLEMLHILAHASGPHGMCAGQAIDLTSVGMSLSLEQLEQMHHLKTGALLRASVLLGALCTPDSQDCDQTLGKTERAALQRYSDAIGLAFQVVDDILDVTSDSVALGKTAGKDAANNKPTYVSILGLEASQTLAENLCIEAQRALDDYTTAQPHSNTQRLSQLADFIARRSD